MKKLIVCGGLMLLLISTSASPAPARSMQCQPVRAVFYTSSDWWRLAQGLGADASPCAQYYISIDPLAANKTQMRPNAAWQVNALGSNFHAVAEVNYTAWKNWVSSTGNSWYAAGQAARASMDATGFTADAGDTWAVNEFPSSVRTNTGGARLQAEQFVQGLHDGDGSDAPEQGIVFMIGVGQTGVSFAQYKASMESWLQDSTFWNAMSADVSDFLFESYGDVRAYAVAGTDPVTRIADLNAFLQHPLALVNAANAPSTTAAARAFLGSAYGPLANASWAWASDYGWTQTTPDVMADYISAQTYAMRAYGAGSRLGFAWNPLNTESLSGDDFNADVASILARLAGSIHETDGGDPAQACEATDCDAVIDGTPPAVPNWSTFSSWTPTVATFLGTPQAATPGVASNALTVELKTGSATTTLPIASTVMLTSSSPTMTFSASPVGPWTSTLALTVPTGSSSAMFYTLDSSAGSPTLTASLNGQPSTETETITAPAVTETTAPPPPAAHVTSLAFVPQGDHMHVAIRVVGDSGQPLQAKVRLALLVGSSTLTTTSGVTTTAGLFGVTARPKLELGCYSVQLKSVTVAGFSWDGASPTQTDCIASLPARVSSVVFARRHGRLHVDVGVVDESGRPVRAHLSYSVIYGSATFAATTGLTNANGRLGITARPKLKPGCYRVRVDSVTAPGFTWDHVSPTNTYCDP